MRKIIISANQIQKGMRVHRLPRPVRTVIVKNDSRIVRVQIEALVMGDSRNWYEFGINDRVEVYV